MKRLIKFGEIESFRLITQTIQHLTQYQGYSPEGKIQYNKNVLLPIVEATGTEKVHGTNASVCYSIPDGFWVQSKSDIITPENDNAQSAKYAYENKEIWIDLIKKLAQEYSIDLNKNIITIYFEWSGEGIQKKTCLTGVKGKKAMIFQHFKVSEVDPYIEDTIEKVKKDMNFIYNDKLYSYGSTIYQKLIKENPLTIVQIFKPAYWLETKYKNTYIDSIDYDIYNVCNFFTIKYKIDFNNAKDANDKLKKLVLDIEERSYIGKAFGKENNIAEGIVFTFVLNDKIFRFKVKGEKHTSKRKIKRLPSKAELEEDLKINEFVNKYACKEFRLEQMYDKVCDILNGGTGDIKKLGDFIKEVVKDTFKEEYDIILKEKLNEKQIKKKISIVAKEYFLNRLDEEIFE